MIRVIYGLNKPKFVKGSEAYNVNTGQGDEFVSLYKQVKSHETNRNIVLPIRLRSV